MNPGRPPPFLCVVGALSLGRGTVWVSVEFVVVGGFSGFGVKGRGKASLAAPGCEGVIDTALRSFWGSFCSVAAG